MKLPACDIWLKLAAFVASFWVASRGFGEESELQTASQFEQGKSIYVQKCASCHGAHGEGVAGKYDETLYGDKSLSELTKIIHETMPEKAPESVVDEEALAVSEYLYDSFYTAEARARNQPPRIELVRLTNAQYANVIADLMANFLGRGAIDEARGLEAQYFDSKNMSRDQRKIERVDPVVSFNFKEGSPGEGIGTAEFAIQWNGSLIVEETGDYEICVKSENGFRLWLNDNSNALIDGWVATGGEVVAKRETVHLLGGRVYPLRLDYFKFKDKTASIELCWRRPGGIEEVIPERLLAQKRVPETVVVNTPFPPDDASLGYERGSAVSKAWAQATTQAAIEVANRVIGQLDRFAGTKRDDNQRKEKLRKFAHRFVELAFRRPLTVEQREVFVDAHFAGSDDPELIVKKVVILALHSPHFLYPELTDNEVDSYDVASRLSFGLWDSIPDETLLQAAANGELMNPKNIRDQAWRMLRTDRTRFKMRGFFHELLPFHEAMELTKDGNQFPGFDKELVADLKTSLELFIDDVLWSEKSDYRELLLSSDLYLNERLAKFYEVDGQGGESFERVSFDPQERSGVVTHPFLLSTLAYQQSSSPIHRGVFITRKILSRSLKPPPMAIEFKESKFDPTLTMREKVAELTKSKACMTCHSTINPLGFSLENYDAVGRYRTMDQEKPVDAKSDFESDGGVVSFTGARDVAEYAAQDETSQKGFLEHLFHHLIKQSSRAYGDETINDLRNEFARSEFNIQKMIVEINVLAASHGIQHPKGK